MIRSRIPFEEDCGNGWRRLASGWYLLFGAGVPIGVVDGGVLEQGGEDEDETHDQVDVDGLDVGDARQRRAHARRDGRHRQHRRDACHHAVNTVSLCAKYGSPF